MPTRMKKFLSSYWKIGLTILFGLAVFLFWRLRYPFVLTYQEQFQLFLFDSDFFVERISEPGGLARYIGEFLTQFYNSPTLGAFILAILFMVFQRLTWILMRPIEHFYYPLSFLPAVILMYAMGDENIMLSYLVATIVAMTTIVGWKHITWETNASKTIKWALITVMIPLLYWLIGPIVVLVAICIMPVSVIWAIACILLSTHLTPFPLSRLAIGISYYRFPDVIPYMLIAIPAVIALLRWAFRIKKISQHHYGPIPTVIFTTLIIVLSMVLVPHGYDTKKYELIEYDYLVRIKDWKGIIAKAEKQMPDLPMSVCATNLALAMTNQLGERAFDFYQRGSEGLLPPFERNFSTTQLTGEVYFYLGLVNTAQRFAFEAMEAIPNYNKSGRMVKRLVETNLINGQYDVAKKYLQMLEKTIFYRPWAQQTMAMLNDTKQIDSHQLYGTLRQFRLEDDFLFSEDELDKICGQLFMHNHDNQMATQYLLMAPLLDKDISRFMQYVKIVQNRVNYNPRICQEAIAFAFMQQREPLPQGIVNPFIQQNLNAFSSVYSSGGQGPQALERFRNTLWYYITVGK